MKRIAGFILVIVTLVAVVCTVTAIVIDLVQPVCVLPRPKSLPRIFWTYEAPQRGGFVAAPWVEGDTIFASAVLTQGLRLTGGVYAIDPTNGVQKWAFFAGGPPGLRPSKLLEL